MGRTGAAAERTLRARLAERAAQAGTDLGPETRLSDLGKVWLAEIEGSGELAPQSINEYRAVLDRLVVPALGGLRIREASVGRLDRFLKEVGADRPARAKQAKVVLKSMMALAVRHDVLSTNPVRDVAPISTRRRPVRALTLPELEAFRVGIEAWQEAPGQRGPRRAPDLLDLVDVMIGTGARIGEVLALLWDDVDLSSEVPTATISATVVDLAGVGLVRQPHPKTSSSRRTVMLPDFAADVLGRLEDAAASAGRQGGLVFPSATGTLRSPNNVRRSFRAARDAAGFSWVTPHTFRRTVATRIDREASTDEAAAQLGHSGVAVTERHYIERHATAPDLRRVLEPLGGRSR